MWFVRPTTVPAETTYQTWDPKRAREYEDNKKIAKKNFDRHRKLPIVYKIGDLVRVERALIGKTAVGKSKN